MYSNSCDQALDPELLATFCRRSRRRLRDVQASCQAPRPRLDWTRSDPNHHNIAKYNRVV